MSLSIFINNHKLICKTQDRTGVAGPDTLDNWLGIEPDYQSRLASVLTCQPRISLHLYPAASVASSPGRRRTPRQKIVTKMLPCSLCYHLDAISCCLISICYTLERFFIAITWYLPQMLFRSSDKGPKLKRWKIIPKWQFWDKNSPKWHFWEDSPEVYFTKTNLASRLLLNSFQET